MFEIEKKFFGIYVNQTNQFYDEYFEKNVLHRDCSNGYCIFSHRLKAVLYLSIYLPMENNKWKLISFISVNMKPSLPKIDIDKIQIEWTRGWHQTLHNPEAMNP